MIDTLIIWGVALLGFPSGVILAKISPEEIEGFNNYLKTIVVLLLILILVSLVFARINLFESFSIIGFILALFLGILYKSKQDKQ